MKRLLMGLVLLALSWPAVVSADPAPPTVEGAQAILAPQLKWERGGCTSWCETGWYSSPAVADLDGDGTQEVIAGAYTIFILNGEDGTEQRRVDTPGSRVWPGVAVADLDNDGDLEIVTGQGDGYLNVLNHAGDVVWTRQPAGNELRGMGVTDLDGDGTLEIVVTSARGNRINTWVYEHDGTLRGGWPQPASEDSGYSWGVYNANAALGDLDGDGTGEIVVPSDVHYICAYEPNGTPIPANAMYGGKVWGKVGIWESLDIELRGWGRCNGDRAESYRTNFADGPAVIADVNGDRVMEVVVTGNVYDCHTNYPPSRYVGVYIFNADRSRFNASGYNWETLPVDTGAPLVENYNVIESAQSDPAVADLDGDGQMEILFSSYDGRVHALWLDKTEHHAWPYAVHTGGAYRFASPPTVADLDADGHAEVIFASWVQKGSNQTGKLHILSYQGTVIHEIDLPVAVGGNTWNGGLAAPTLANIDADADLEVVLNTAHSGFVAYDLPGTATARVLWGTARGSYWRDGWLKPRGSLDGSWKRVQHTPLDPGARLTYTLHLDNPGPLLPNVRLTDTLPGGLHYLGNLWASSGSYGEAGGVITWTGAVGNGLPVTLTYNIAITMSIVQPLVIINTAQINDGQGVLLERTAVAILNGRSVYLPLVLRN